MYGLLNGENMFDLGWPPKVKGQGQTLETLKSNISKTVQDREKVSNRKSYMDFQMVEIFLTSRDH